MNFNIPECQTSTTISTVSGTQEYAKPTDMQKLDNLFYQSAELTKIDKADSLRSRSTTAIPSNYYMYGSNI